MTIANVGDYETGLEEFGVEDAVIPRLSIVHKDGQFKDSLSNEQFPKLTVIILGLVKQRVLWHTELDDGDWPMCRSTNHDLGFPNMSDDQPKSKRFPWVMSGFDQADYPADENGLVSLPCSGCQLKEWKSHPDGKRPYCSEQFTLPVLYDPRDDENWVPAIITFQKTALKPLKAYLSSFARSRGAAFQAVTEIGLDMLRRGTTDYSVPSFKRVGDTDEAYWREYSASYRSMADFLRAAPGAREEDADGDAKPVAPSSNVAKPPTLKKPEPKKAPEPAPEEDIVDGEVVEEAPAVKKAAPVAPVAPVEDDDDLPF